MTRGASQSGMTLVETLVGLVILTLMAVLSLQLIDASNRTFDQGERMNDMSSRTAAIEFVRTQLESAAPQVERIEGGAPILLFRGERDSIVFVSSEPMMAETQCQQLTKLSVESSDLIVERTPLCGERASQRRILIHGVTRLEIAYSGEGGPAELNSWKERSALPGLITLTVTGADWGRRATVQIVVRPAISAA